MKSKYFVLYILSASLLSCTRVQKPPLVTDIQLPADPMALPVHTDTVAAVNIAAGSYIPLFGDKTPVDIATFSMDVYPVTNQQYLAFIKQYPAWQRSAVKSIFADGHYLSYWEQDTVLGAAILPDAPVTNVSWFAAKAYCACQGKQLPTVDQWEYVARADATSFNAADKVSYNNEILAWYEQPPSFNQPVGKTTKNKYGISDMHGLIWEWTLDFNSVMLTGESRQDASGNNKLFCGSGSAGASDRMNYAAFMRYAFRNSLKANFCINSQGFRCVQKNK